MDTRDTLDSPPGQTPAGPATAPPNAPEPTSEERPGGGDQAATAPDAGPRAATRLRGPLLQVAVAAACALLGFLLVAQVRATEDLGERLESEREEDLAQILSDLSAQTDRLQSEYTELQLTLLAFQSTAENEELALRSLERRLDDLRILAGVVAAEGEGIVFTIDDPQGQVSQDLLVDTVQELRDAGAEAIAVNDVRLIASSAFVTRNGRLVVDGQPLDPPFRIVVVGPAETMAKALAIPGGAVDALESAAGVTATVEQRGQTTVPARGEAAPFVFGEPVPADPETAP